VKLYPPEEMVTEIHIDPVTGRRIEVKAWKGNALKLGGIHLGPALCATLKLRGGWTRYRRASADERHLVIMEYVTALRCAGASWEEAVDKASKEFHRSKRTVWRARKKFR
jgi:hypothetical protein